ncbi:MAG: YfcE family phosphodiesterase [Desulfuromonadaceae bacterium]
MIKIGVVSDTHIHTLREGAKLVDRLLAGCFSQVDMIFHAGDLVNPALLDLFSDLPVHAVRGNMDPPTCDLPSKKIIEVGTFRIGLMHGWGHPTTLEERLQHEFRKDEIDCLVYGHSHYPVCYVNVAGMLIFYPGSVTDRRSAPQHTVGVLEIDQSISGRIIAVD